MHIAVLVKQVPDTFAERKLVGAEHTMDRESTDAVLDEINERAVEEALRIKERHGGEITAVCAGPDQASESIRKALAMGADSAVHLSDEAMRGSDALVTARVLAKVLATIDAVDLVLAGDESTDGRAGAIPAMLAELLGRPQLTCARSVTIEGDEITIERETDKGMATLRGRLPAVVSINEKINDPRYPNFLGIKKAKTKPLRALSLADLDVDFAVGGAGSFSRVVDASPAEEKQPGVRITDDGDAAKRIVEFLAERKLL